MLRNLVPVCMLTFAMVFASASPASASSPGNTCGPDTVKIKNGKILIGDVLEKIPGSAKILMFVESEHRTVMAERFIDYDSIEVHNECRQEPDIRPDPHVDPNTAETIGSKIGVRFLYGVRIFDYGAEEASSFGVELYAFDSHYGEILGWEGWDSENTPFETDYLYDGALLTAHSVYWGPVVASIDRDRSLWLGVGGGLMAWEISYADSSRGRRAWNAGGFLFGVLGFGIRIVGHIHFDLQGRYCWPQFDMGDAVYWGRFQRHALEGVTVCGGLRFGLPD